MEFDPKLNRLGKDKELRQGLSVVIQIGDSLCVTNDETVSLERLSRVAGEKEGDLKYGDHKQFALSDYLGLPVSPPDGIEEADVEGLDYRGGYLWLVGSHSLKRKQPDKKTLEKNFERLADVTSDGNRYLLARIPVVEKGGSFTLEKEVSLGGERRVAAQLPCSEIDNDLTKALAEDMHLGRFLKIPGKDNGFDIEGLAVTNEGRVFLGLRGPVLRGWAVILELEPEPDERDQSSLKLKGINSKNPFNPSNPTYRKHFLNLGGLGIRDLCLHGSDLLILSGPTMDLDGPVTVFRWKGGASPKGESLVPFAELEKVIDIPYGVEEDHAEGIALFSPDGQKRNSLLVVYDSASCIRQAGASGLKADVFALPD